MLLVCGNVNRSKAPAMFVFPWLDSGSNDGEFVHNNKFLANTVTDNPKFALLIACKRSATSLNLTNELFIMLLSSITFNWV